MLKSSTFPPYGAFTPIMSCTAQAASRRNPGHAGNACPGEKCSVTWISLVYRPAGETVIGYCYLSATANAMPTGLRLKIRCTSIRLISGRGRKSLTRSCPNMGPVSGIPPDDSGCGGQCERRVCSAASSRRFTEIGTLKDIGFKHGRWLDTVLLQRQLGKGAVRCRTVRYPDAEAGESGIAPFGYFSRFLPHLLLSRRLP